MLAEPKGFEENRWHDNCEDNRRVSPTRQDPALSSDMMVEDQEAYVVPSILSNFTALGCATDKAFVCVSVSTAEDWVDDSLHYDSFRYHFYHRRAQTLQARHQYFK
jgi:hypothetical protein